MNKYFITGAEEAETIIGDKGKNNEDIAAVIAIMTAFNQPEEQG